MHLCIVHGHCVHSVDRGTLYYVYLCRYVIIVQGINYYKNPIQSVKCIVKYKL